MKLKIRYENEIQILNLNEEDTEKLWVSLSLEGDNLPQEERDRRIQAAFDERYNKPEYNNWHKATRHVDPNPKRRRFDGKPGYIQGEPGDESFDVMDYLAFTEDRHTSAEDEYDEVCDLVRSVLAKKPEWAEAFIAVCLNGESETDYARRTGDSQSNIAHKLTRAKKKLKEFFENRHNPSFPKAT